MSDATKMSDYGRAVLDQAQVQHIASTEFGYTVCGERWIALDLYWDTITRIHCTRCLELMA